MKKPPPTRSSMTVASSLPRGKRVGRPRLVRSRFAGRKVARLGSPILLLPLRPARTGQNSPWAFHSRELPVSYYCLSYTDTLLIEKHLKSNSMLSLRTPSPSAGRPTFQAKQASIHSFELRARALDRTSSAFAAAAAVASNLNAGCRLPLFLPSIRNLCGRASEPSIGHV